MQSLKQFKPTEAQIRAAENTLVAMTHEQTVRPVVERYETEILARHQFPIAAKWVEKGIGHSIILDRKQAFLLSEEHASIFYKECEEARIASKLTVMAEGNCPLCEAEHVRIQAENALLESMATIPGMEVFAKRVLTLEMRARAIDLILGLLAPFVANGADILARFGVTKPA